MTRPSYDHRQVVIIPKICSLLRSLGPSTYDDVAPKVEYWIECALNDHSIPVGQLAEQVASVPWTSSHGSHASVVRFLKEFRDALHRSEQAKTFINDLCTHVLRWFTAASAEDAITMEQGMMWSGSWVVMHGGRGFISAASFVGNLVERGLLSHDLVRRLLVKSLIAHHYTDRDGVQKSVRAMAIYKLFVTAGNTLLQGLLDPEDVEACFKTLDAKISLKGVVGPNAGKLNVLYSSYPSASRQKLATNL